MSLPSTPEARHVWVVVACGAAIVTLSMGVRQASGLFLQPIQLDLGIGREAFGLAVAVQNLILGLAQPFVGALADRFGAGRIAVVGTLLYVAGLVLAARAGDALGLQLSLGALVGIAMSGTTFVVVLGAVGRFVRPEQRGLAFGLVTAGGSLGQFLVVPGASALIGAYGWRNAFLLLGVLVLLMAPLAAGIAGRSRAGSAGERKLSLGDALHEAGRHPGYWLINGGFFVCGFHIAFIATHLPAFLTDRGLDPSTGATALALVGLFNIFGSYAFGLAADRLRKKNVLAWLYLARGAVIVAFLAAPVTDSSAILFACAMGFLWLGTVPLTSGLVGQIFGVRHLSTLFGIVFMSHQIGSFFGAWAAGWAYEAFGSYDLAWGASIVLAVAAALFNLPVRDAPVGGRLAPAS